MYFHTDTLLSMESHVEYFISVSSSTHLKGKLFRGSSETECGSHVCVSAFLHQLQQQVSREVGCVHHTRGV